MALGGVQKLLWGMREAFRIASFIYGMVFIGVFKAFEFLGFSGELKMSEK